MLTASASLKLIAVARASDRALLASFALVDAATKELLLAALSQTLAVPDFKTKVAPGGRYRLDGDVNSICFTCDSSQRVFACVVDKQYPARVAFDLLGKLAVQFVDQYGSASLSCPPNGLDRTSRRLLSELFDQFVDPAKVDKLIAINRDSQVVKEKMITNINSMIKNMDVAQGIAKVSDEMLDESAKFRDAAENISFRERCRAYKLYICAAIGVAIIIVTVALALAL